MIRAPWDLLIVFGIPVAVVAMLAVGWWRVTRDTANQLLELPLSEPPVLRGTGSSTPTKVCDHTTPRPVTPGDPTEHLGNTSFRHWNEHLDVGVLPAHTAVRVEQRTGSCR